MLGNQSNTRCLGNYLVKGCYKEFNDLTTAIQEPIIAEPDINGGIPLDDSCKFMLMMSSGLLETVEEVVNAEQVNKYIAQCVVEQVNFIKIFLNITALLQQSGVISYHI